MKTICCICKALVRDGPTGPNGEVSHGYCPRCYKNELRKLEKTKDEKDQE